MSRSFCLSNAVGTHRIAQLGAGQELTVFPHPAGPGAHPTMMDRSEELEAGSFLPVNGDIDVYHFDAMKLTPRHTVMEVAASFRVIPSGRDDLVSAGPGWG